MFTKYVAQRHFMYHVYVAIFWVGLINTRTIQSHVMTQFTMTYLVFGDVRDTSQQTRHNYPMFDQCWPNVVDGGPTLVEHWVDVSCLLG